MKSKEQKQKDLEALTEELGNAKSALVLSFDKLTVDKDQEFRAKVRDAGAKYQVVKNTIARLAVEGTTYAEAKEHFTGVSAIAWTEDEPVDLSKAVSNFIKDNSNIFSFKTGVVEGKVVDLNKIKEIAELPSKDELIGKLLYLLNAPAQRLATVLNAIPRDLAVVLKQISEGQGTVEAPKAEAKEEPKAEKESAEAKPEEAKAETEKSETEAPVQEDVKAEAASDEKAETETSNEEVKAETVENAEAETSGEETEAEKSE